MGQPLDPKRAFFYGQFVQAAYTMFRTPGPDPLRPEPAGIPDGYELGAWIHMSDFVLNIKEPEFYGIVVHGIQDPDSRIIAIRGTRARSSGSTMRRRYPFRFVRCRPPGGWRPASIRFIAR